MNVTMEKVLIITILFFNSMFAIGQTNSKALSNGDIDNLMHKIVEQKSQFVGKPVKYLYDYLEISGYPIKYMATISDGPWSQPDCKEYITGVILYNRDEEELSPRANMDVMIVYIPLNIKVNYETFWKSVPDDNWIEYIKKWSSELNVVDISFKWTQIWSFGKPIDEG